MTKSWERRVLLKRGAQTAAAVILGGHGAALAGTERKKPLFRISLAQWSLNRALFSKKLDNLDFAKVAREDYGIGAVEYVNQFFKDKATDEKYLREMKKRASDHGVKSRLIMCDGEGALGDPDEAKRKQAIENHYRWVEAAKFLGCFAIRVNAQSSGTYFEQIDRAADGLHRLAEYGAKHDIKVIVENHGGHSSNGTWLAAVIRKAGPNAGTLPDFGNFNLGNGKQYNRYLGVTELMPYAKAVSAKTHDFDAQGNETETDYRQMLKIVLDAGYHSYLGIEYEGSRLPEPEGIKLSKALLERVRDEMDG